MGAMNFLSFRELRASTARINEMLTDDGKIVVTSNGKPKAIMIRVSESDFEDTLAMINQVRITRAVDNIRSSAAQNGASELTADEIEDEIAQTRRERRVRRRQENGNA